MRHLVLVLGDQLDARSAAFEGFDRAQDSIWMSETPQELTHVWCHKQRIAFFLSAMRHFRDELRERGLRVHYNSLATHEQDDRGTSFADLLTLDLTELAPAKLIVVEPGDYRVLTQLRETAAALELDLEVRADRTFLCSTDEFKTYAAEHKSLLLETFYRWMRRRQKILVDIAGKPIGGRWNFDKDNRQSFGRRGPGVVPDVERFAPDATTREVLELVAQRFAAHPGSLKQFDLPVTRSEALAALTSFVREKLPRFGAQQDAMWTSEPFLYHSRLSAALNVKLIHADEVVAAVVAAYEEGAAPLTSVEAFVRQVIGWRELMRGVYWTRMPGYASGNALDATLPLPQLYWTGETDMNCLRHSVGHVVDHAYAHHIQRLMVIGNFALLAGVDPRAFHDWHMAMYADAIDWVSLPNALGMSQHADGGVVGTKPYCASGNYINRMSNYCRGCRYDPHKATGDDACPFTTLYWDFLDRHRERFAGNPRMRYPLENVARKSAGDLRDIRRQAEQVRNAP